ncbi:hypothetical protein BJ508DRAFT_336130 [Ascobolus immersus RN42]|uniref:Uncharacterized protein n=1 Tax=Ascobolus immersus RN42 TaxID=1160509 RepID=A0A3N4HG24_ASCIM|nr:hypothetical protein BJ508DRAFT_336130 [Ascobolus immersus RN42]
MPDRSRYQRHHEASPPPPATPSATPAESEKPQQKQNGRGRGGRNRQHRNTKPEEIRKFASEIFGTYLEANGYRRQQHRNPPREVSRSQQAQAREKDQASSQPAPDNQTKGRPKPSPEHRARSRSPLRQRPADQHRRSRSPIHPPPETVTVPPVPTVTAEQIAQQIALLQAQLSLLVQQRPVVPPKDSDGDTTITDVTRPPTPVGPRKTKTRANASKVAYSKEDFQAAACLIVRQRANPTNKYNIDPSILSLAQTIVDSEGEDSVSRRTAFRAASKAYSSRKLTVVNVANLQALLRPYLTPVIGSSSPLSSVPELTPSIPSSPAPKVILPAPRTTPALNMAKVNLPVPTSSSTSHTHSPVPVTPIRRRSSNSSLPTHRSQPSPLNFTSPTYDDSDETLQAQFTEASFQLPPVTSDDDSGSEPQGDDAEEPDQDTAFFYSPSAERSSSYTSSLDSQHDITLRPTDGHPLDLLLNTTTLPLDEPIAPRQDAIFPSLVVLLFLPIVYSVFR